MRRLIMTCTLIGMLVLGAAASFAGPGFGPGRGDCQDCEVTKWSCDRHPGGAIDLSDDQRAKIDEISKEERQRLDPLREEMLKLREEIHSVMEATPIDESRARQLAREKADKKIDMKLIKQEYRSRVEAILNPDQLEKIKERREWRQENRRHGGKKFGHGKRNCGNCNKSEK